IQIHLRSRRCLAFRLPALVSPPKHSLRFTDSLIRKHYRGASLGPIGCGPSRMKPRCDRLCPSHFDTQRPLGLFITTSYKPRSDDNVRKTLKYYWWARKDLNLGPEPTRISGREVRCGGAGRQLHCDHRQPTEGQCRGYGQRTMKSGAYCLKMK